MRHERTVATATVKSRPAPDDTHPMDAFADLDLVDADTGMDALLDLLVSCGRFDLGDLHARPTHLRNAHLAVHEELDEADWSTLGAGSYRITYEHHLAGGLVLKAPTYGDDCSYVWGALLSNLYEAGDAAYDYTLPIMPRRLLWHSSGIPLVAMELAAGREDMREKRDTWPREHAAEVDKSQVAWSHELGTWAIYDAGCPPHRFDVDPPQWLVEQLELRRAAQCQQAA